MTKAEADFIDTLTEATRQHLDRQRDKMLERIRALEEAKGVAGPEARASNVLRLVKND